MIKEQTYGEKFALLEPWLDAIFGCVKKELRSEHLRRNPQIVNKYFSKKALDKITNEEIKDAYYAEILQGNEEIGEWVASRWMFKHAEIYQFFAVCLSKINPDFEQIEEIPEDKALALMQSSVGQFGAATTYIFSIFNVVSFPQAVFQSLKEVALKPVTEEVVPSEALSLEALREKHEKEIAKLTDKYEKRLLGLQRKYTDDVSGFKKQIADLQRRMQSGPR